jgi:putative hemolysin
MTWMATVGQTICQAAVGAPTACCDAAHRHQRHRTVTEAEIVPAWRRAWTPESSRSTNTRWCSNVFDLDDRPLTSMMLPRADIEWLEATATVAQCLQKVGQDAVAATRPFVVPGLPWLAGRCGWQNQCGAPA